MNDHEKEQMLRARAVAQKLSECDIWEGQLSRDGYPRFTFARRDQRVARVLWELIRGPIPDGHHLDHVLRNVYEEACSTACICLYHLESVPGAINVARGRSPSAHNKRKTHCHLGHAFDAANTIVRFDGGRECRACRRRHHQASRARRFDQLECHDAIYGTVGGPTHDAASCPEKE